jgi:NTE family protein
MMEEHRMSGYKDAVRTLRHPEVVQWPNGQDSFFTFGLGRDGRE